jgi:predicted nucleic acid-binding protein
MAIGMAATSIAVELEYSGYDFVYVSVAEATDLRLATADGAFVREAHEAYGRS